MLALACCLGLAIGACAEDQPAPREPVLGVSGTYTTTIEAENFKRAGDVYPSSFGGEWTMTLDESDDSYVLEAEGFGRVSGNLEPGVTTYELRFNDEPAPTGAFNCYVDGERSLEDGDSLYRFRLEDEVLLLRATREPCPLREVILARRWMRRS